MSAWKWRKASSGSNFVVLPSRVPSILFAAPPPPPGAANKMEGKRKIFLYLAAVPIVVFLGGPLSETIVKSEETVRPFSPPPAGRNRSQTRLTPCQPAFVQACMGEDAVRDRVARIFCHQAPSLRRSDSSIYFLFFHNFYCLTNFFDY